MASRKVRHVALSWLLFQVEILTSNAWPYYCRSMNDPWSQYVTLFSNAVMPANRASFISKVFAFLEQWGFDG